MRNSVRTGIVAALAGAGAALLAFVAVPALAGTSKAAADDPATSLVEDFSYPGAAEILAEYNVKLISGDGHIIFADCHTPPVGNVGVLKVSTTAVDGPDADGIICFKVTGPRGLLNLEVPGVYNIRGDGQAAGSGHRGTADLKTDDGAHQSVNLNPNGIVAVGEGTGDPNAQPTMLLRLTITG